MTPAARVAAAIGILDRWLVGAPLEAAYTAWAKASRFAGSGDRAAVRDLLYDAVRRKRSYAALGGAETGRGLMLGAVRAAGTAPEEVFTGTGHGPEALRTDEVTAGRTPLGAEALDLPDWLLPSFEVVYGPRTADVLEILRERAPVHLRINLRRLGRAEAVRRLGSEGIRAVPHPTVESAVEITEGTRRLARSALLTGGLAEPQDASSQAVVARLCREAPVRVLDYCAGAGGKALAFADLSEADIVAHDIAWRRMAPLEGRAARAGARVRKVAPEALAAEAPFDLVFCDAPCSGSGTWRRDPEAKWRLTPERLAELQAMQRTVVRAAAAHVGPGGRLAYATCSVLAEENEQLAGAAAELLPGWTEEDRLRLDPGPAGDGFFLVSFRAPR
ncbi:RsmB/NOP family class I SAM-dependent RNA methyltransferase [Histidinibacterium lentulum]|uniref:RsmB/NOP family class I SAM-dependent RNA methyltransferase n=1 Tax=Histidinibacterium lentulum TaxID=2480588 RepID=A0A3N2R9U5_9RHOB|nr:RsmB/NOP family class I SAM-dependent RNA methyltransferase [Histidinibacterium lentulum]ROU04198.1 RsmB/NOP family class I SAM-dependent RNA methyltransferase [Histidinibacterium lentulum]